MTSHEIIKQLRAMKQKLDLNGWAKLDAMLGIYKNRNLLLSIAEAFRPGDATLIADLADQLEESNWKKYEDEIIVLRRLQAAAERLEE